MNHQIQNELPDIVGLIGIGLVGAALAECYMNHNITVVGYDIEASRLDLLKHMGGYCAKSPKDVVSQVRYVVLSLPNSDVVQKVIEGPDGILSSQNKPDYIIDTTTGDPDQVFDLAQRLSNYSISYLDATICGASSQISKGETIFMVGGESRAYEACSHLLHLLTNQVIYVGSSGSGSKAKLATNLVLGLNRLVLAEGMVFAEKLGLSLETFLNLLKVSPAYSVAVDVKGEKMLHRDFEAVSRIRQHHKDVSLMLKHALNRNQHLPLTQLHFDILEKSIAAGDGELDTSAVIQEIRRRTIPDSDS